MDRKLRKFLAILLVTFVAILLNGWIASVQSQEKYPSKPIEIIVPFLPGGSADLVGRLVADRLKRKFRVPVSIVNKPGGNCCAERRAQIFNLTAKNLFQLEGQNPHLATFGEMGDISNLCQFGWYEWCYFRQHNAGFPQMQDENGSRI